MKKIKNTHFIKSLKNAGNGFKLGLREQNFRIEIIAAFIVVFFGILFNITRTEWIICIVLIALVFALELVNTTIETITNIISPFWNPKAKAIKDLSAAAVAVFAAGALIVGLIIFLPYFIALF